jgi:HEAT repeat protein
VLAQGSPTPEARGRVREAWGSMFERVQSAAAQVLGAWGDGESRATLRSWLLMLLEQPQGWGIRGVVVAALARTLSPADTDWVLDLYFSRPDRLSKQELLPLAAAVYPDAARDRLLQEAGSRDPLNRHAALRVIARMPYGDREQLIQRFLHDSEPYNRRSARSILST